MNTLLQVMDLTKIYKNQARPSLDRVSFRVQSGEFLGIMGLPAPEKPPF